SAPAWATAGRAPSASCSRRRASSASPAPGSRRATSTTSSSPRKRPITAWSRPRALALTLAAGVAAAAATGAGGSGRPEEPLLTYFTPEHALTLHYPSSWKAEQAQQDGVWYRYFLAPPTGPGNKPAVSVTLIAGPLGAGVSVDRYAQT